MIHVIDKVLLPRTAKVAQELPATGGSTQNATYMVVLAVLGLLLAGATVRRAFERSA